MTLSPSDHVRTELVGALDKLPTRLGDVHRLTTDGLEAHQIATKLGIPTSGFVSNYRTYLRTILEGVPPHGRTMVPQAAGHVRRLLETANLSTDAQRYLTRLLRELADLARTASPGRSPKAASPRLPPPPKHSPGTRALPGDPIPSQTEVPARLPVPSDEIRKAVRDLLRQDQTRLGQVFRLTEQGLNPEAIAEELGVRTSNFVSNNRIIARALVDGVPPRGDSLKLDAATRARSLTRGSGLPPEVSTYLHQLEDALVSGTAAPAAGRSRRQDAPPGHEARDDVSPHRLRGMLESLIQRIEAETDVQPGDYEKLGDDPDVMTAIGRHVGARKAGKTFVDLFQRHRLDLTLESFIVKFGQQIGIGDQERQMAEDRLMYFSELD